MQQSTVISVGERSTTRGSMLERALAAANGDRDPALGRLLERYYRHVDDEDLFERDPADVAGAVLSHRELATRRPVGTSAVRAFTPSRQADGRPATTVIEVVTDDMPFLIDSVTGLLDGEGFGVQLVVHPQLVVRRDVTGGLLEVLDADPEDDVPPGALVESWIRLEVDRERDPERLERLAQRLRAVLDDVRICVEDWPRMQHRAGQLARELREHAPPGIPDAEAAQTADLLDWLANDHFTFLGYREYRLVVREGQDMLGAVPGTGLGLLRHDQPAGSTGYRRLGARARAKARERVLLVLTKANSRSTVHRRAYLDYIGIKVFDQAGNVVGEKRFLGLFGASAYIDDALDVPVVAGKVAEVLRRSGLPKASHSGKDLRQILETYPRDELFQISVDDLTTIATGVLRLQGKRRTRLFVRPDVYGRFVSCLVFLPRDRFNTDLRLLVQSMLADAFDGSADDWTTMLGDSPLARLHVVVRTGTPDAGLDPDRVNPDTVRELEDRIARATRTWEEDLADALAVQAGEQDGTYYLRRWGAGLPEEYKAAVRPDEAVADLARFEVLGPGDLASAVYPDPDPAAGPGGRRFKVYSRQPLSLSRVLPYLANLGAEVVDERPYMLTRREVAGPARTGTNPTGQPGAAEETQAYLYDFGLRFAACAGRPDDFAARLREAFGAAMSGRCDNDGFNRLVSAAGLTWRQVAVLRAYARYLRQTGLGFSQAYLAACLAANLDLATALVRLFEARFDPDVPPGQRDDLVARCEAAVESGLDAVPGLDHDRILRGLYRAIGATLRTNAYRPHASCLAIKLDPRALPEVPQPRPAAEVFVHSPRVEGVHLRFGPAARGGLRWSDRPEDLRTEVLGLVKAQVVKNAVIVPTGAKGGFVPRRLPDPAQDREAWLAEGRACYEIFISGLLDVTDNLVDGAVVPPRRVVRHDGDDPYLVVAADKGTATFSDLANRISARYGFWLGDAFASGGSAGYDHKAMGITARGAWISVEQHLRDLDQHDGPIVTVGIGDMSGDVFGNGMLRSRRIALVAAFDHRHVFLDPDPDPGASFDERARLFALPRSSWADYDPALLSEGGGVYPRTAKAIPVSPQVARRLGLTGTGPAPSELTPSELIRAILLAPVDLLWNGGIGTYVKASSESHADAADKSNDAIRVDGRDLRVKIVGEGGNLGLTQAARIEAALAGRGGAGVRLNTDAVDNSAGVDCSDHEVNLKILLDSAVRAGELSHAERDELLAQMTDDVARLVLRDNVEQNILLTTAASQAVAMGAVHQRFLTWLEQRGLDREREGLPRRSALADRLQNGRGLTTPELSVLMAHAKITLCDALLAGDLPDDAGATWPLLRGYFPPQVRDRFAARIAEHPLRREITANALANELVNDCGMTFVFRAQEELQVPVEDVCRAYLVVRKVFATKDYLAAVEALDGTVSSAVQCELRLAYRRLLDRAVRWFVQTHPGLGVEDGALTREEAEHRYVPAVREVAQQLSALLGGTELKAWHEGTEHFVAQGVPASLAQWASGTLFAFQGLDIADLGAELGLPVPEVAAVYFAASERLRVDAVLRSIAGLPRADRWQALARTALRFDLYAALGELTRVVLLRSPGEDGSVGSGGPDGPAGRLRAWERSHGQAVERATRTIDEALGLDQPDLAALSVALRTLRGVLAGAGRRP